MIRVLALLLAGCAVPSSSVKSIDGISYIEMIDHPDNPCGNRRYTDGCFAEYAGVKYVYRSSVSPFYVEKHEVAHAILGMDHTAWEFDKWRKMTCSTITKESVGYPLGWKICNNGKSEWVFKEES